MDRGARILIVDEATSTLPPGDAKGVIRSLAAAATAGATVVMVTHKLSEILEATSRVLVILDGEMVRDAPTQGLDRAALVQMLMQHESDPHNLDGEQQQAGELVLELRDVCFASLGPVNLALRAGEVIGISGLPGSGLHDIALLVHGTLKPDSGDILPARPRLSKALVPPHRESQGGFGELSIRENMALSALGRWRGITRLLNPRREELDCAAVSADLAIKPASIDTTFDILSGGNKQKAIFGRALLLEPDVFVLCEPTRGVDVGTRSEIYRLIRQLARGGAAVLVASSDAEDLFSVCDRVSLVTDGRLQPLRPVSELSPSELELMV
jgi:ribose transport system ATP-binding protein